METKAIFKQTKQLYAQLKTDLEQIELEQKDIIIIAEYSLMKIDDAIKELKYLISDHIFNNIAEEIYFFKEVKPLFISLFIYYSTTLSIETYKPVAGHKSLKKHFESELEKIQAYYQENAEFCSYYKRKATYLDHKYFVRNSFDIKMNIPLAYYNYDSNFTTSHDHHVSQIMAYKKMEHYLKKSISDIQKGSITESSPNATITWSAPKVALIELIYGLYHMRCFNGGNIELSEVMKFVEKSLVIDLGNYHKTIFEIRNRKNGTTKFLKNLSDNLNQHFADSEQL
ncbi:RteC domain-containing protein [Chryseobacterium sp. RLHN22]|uniref:RteC domain-containing protein n=1 Tax=Chryseobacterium sp. RLHN22 TaxID=3437885 RepID=UPI003D9B14D5